MTFHWPYALLALPFVLAALGLLFAGSNRARQTFLAQFAAARLLPLLLVSYSPALRKFKHILLAVGVSLTVVAFARPQWGYDWQEQRARGVDVIFALDTSKSMLSQDIQPSRIERAKLAIYDCLEKMGSNRVGLVAFAGDAFLQCPLTLDYDAFRQSLEAVDTHSIAQGGTNIAAGLREAASALEKSGNHKIIVLITDGEDLEGGGIQEARDLHEQEGVTIYTVGVGTAQGELIPVRDTRGRVDYLRDASGQVVKSSLDSSTLTQIAEATGGFYQPLGATGEGLTRIYDEGIKHITEDSLTSRLQRQPIERFQWPLGAGLLLLALEFLIGTRRPSWRRTTVETANLSEPLPPVIVKQKDIPAPPPAGAPPVVAALAFFALGLACSPQAQAAPDAAPPPPDQPAPASAASAPDNPAPSPTAPPAKYTSPKTAQNLFQHGDYKDAAEAYGRASTAAPQDGRFRYNQGAALYRDKDYEGAVQAFTQSLATSDLSLQQRAYYNLGNAQYRIGQADLQADPKKTVASWESAVNAYQSAVELNPGDDDARYNLELVKKQLEELKKKLEEQEKQKEQQDQQKQDQPQQDQQQNQPNDQNQQDQQQNGQNNNQNQQNQPNQQDQQQPNNNNNQSGQNQQNQQQNQSSNGQNQPQNQQNQGQNQQQNQPQNQSGNNQEQNQQQQNQPGDQKQGDSNQQNPQNQSGQNQNGRQNPENGKQPANPQNRQDDRGQPQNQPPQNRGQDQRDSRGQRGENQNANQQRGNQSQAQPKPADGQNKEPASANAGQPSKPQPAGAGNTTADAAGNKPGTEGGGMVAVPGVMTREEARLILDALKTSERKLPATRYISTNQTANEPDQPHKDW